MRDRDDFPEDLLRDLIGEPAPDTAFRDALQRNRVPAEEQLLDAVIQGEDFDGFEQGVQQTARQALREQTRSRSRRHRRFALAAAGLMALIAGSVTWRGLLPEAPPGNLTAEPTIISHTPRPLVVSTSKQSPGFVVRTSEQPTRLTFIDNDVLLATYHDQPGILVKNEAGQTVYFTSSESELQQIH